MSSPPQSSPAGRSCPCPQGHQRLFANQIGCGARLGKPRTSETGPPRKKQDRLRRPSLISERQRAPSSAAPVRPRAKAELRPVRALGSIPPRAGWRKPASISVFSVVPRVRCCFRTPFASQSVSLLSFDGVMVDRPGPAAIVRCQPSGPHRRHVDRMLDAEDEMSRAQRATERHPADEPRKILDVMGGKAAERRRRKLLVAIQGFPDRLAYSVRRSAVSALARASMFSERSTPSTLAPPWLIAHRANQPKPQPRSSTRFPRSSGKSYWRPAIRERHPIRARIGPSGCRPRRNRAGHRYFAPSLVHAPKGARATPARGASPPASRQSRAGTRQCPAGRSFA